ncbi:MAG TPA: hypothetical protein VH186_08305 [Chloroflexia bacterium]|nr:hypothetical protein [Chloroflexia bacterium]
MLSDKDFVAKEVTLFRVKGIQKWAGIILSVLIAFAFPFGYLNFASTTPIKASLFYDGYEGEAFTALVLILIFTVLIWWVSLKLFRAIVGQLLVVGPGGISYKRDNRYVIMAGWDDIVAYGYTVYGLRRIESFYVRREAVYKGKAAKTGQRKTHHFLVKDPASPLYLSAGDYIPLSFFSSAWERDRLGSLIRQYCPRLFEHDGNGRAILGIIPKSAASEHSDQKPPGLADLKRSFNPAVTFMVVSLAVISVLLVFFGYLVQSGRERVVEGQVTQTAIAYRAQRAATITAAPETRLKNYAEGLPEVQSFDNGQIPFTNQTWAYSQQSASNLKTFYARVFSVNPFDSSRGSWEYGFLVTSSNGNGFLFSINVNDIYSVYQTQGGGGSAPTRLNTGILKLINNRAADLNEVEVFGTGDKISFVVNHSLVATEPQSPDVTYELKMAYYPSTYGSNPTATPLAYRDFDIRGIKG